MMRFKKQTPLIITFLLLLFIAVNPFNSVTAKSINNQEFFSYHISDIFKEVFSKEAKFNLDSFIDTYGK